MKLTQQFTIAARLTDLNPRVAMSHRSVCGTTPDAQNANRQLSLCAPHTVVSQHISTLPHTSGRHILLL